VQTTDMSITIDGVAMPCYLARPDGDDPKGAVIVLQEIFGVNTEVRRITDLLAATGYVALAINYYYRTDPTLNEPYTPEGMAVGFKAAAALTKANLRTDVAAAIDWLNAQPYVATGRVATWGFCLGGTVAFVTATLPGLAAAVSFYGGHIAQPMPDGEPEPLADVSEIRAPILLAFGGKDDYIPQSAVERIRAALTAANKKFEIQVYPDCGHAFFRESSASMNSADVADAWDLVQAFLARYLA
jgi:carboxymethylenebutenolidase